MLKEQFNKRIEENQNKENELLKKFSNVGNLKIIFAIITIILLYFSSKNNLLYFVTFFSFVILIVLFVNQHNIGKKIDYYKSLRLINLKFIDRITGDWVKFTDKGEEFVDENHPYSSDLDIVGNKSLFQLINLTNTYLGRNTLAKNLLNIDFSKEKIYKKQEATKELSGKMDFTQDFEYYSSKIKDDESILDLIEYLEIKDEFSKKSYFKPISRILPVVTIIILAVGFLLDIMPFKVISSVLLLFQWIWGFAKVGKVNSYVGVLEKYNNKLNKYEPLLNLIEKESFESEELIKLKENLFNKEVSATTAIKELNFIVQMVNFRHNTMLYFILNILTLWDFIYCFKLESWKKKYSKNALSWFNSIAEFESFLSLSVLNNIINKVSYPQIIEEKKLICTEIGHPLINNNSRVNNNFILNDEIIILSGSNMSGKTTFLRTLGINLVLSYNGACVCSDELKIPILNIVTSMRIADDLNEGISTFYAELIKIKRIIEEARNNEKMIFMIDEIFRGTNSEDRLFGAKEVLKNLLNKKSIGLLTTHDLDITKIDDKRIKNMHFREKYEDGKIDFDYKLREGVCQSTNAKELMRMVGITEV